MNTACYKLDRTQHNVSGRLWRLCLAIQLRYLICSYWICLMSQTGGDERTLRLLDHRMRHASIMFCSSPTDWKKSICCDATQRDGFFSVASVPEWKTIITIYCDIFVHASSCAWSVYHYFLLDKLRAEFKIFLPICFYLMLFKYSRYSLDLNLREATHL